MAQTVAELAQLTNRLVEFLRLGLKHVPVNARPPVGGKHAADLFERKAGGAPQRDQRQLFQYGGVKQTAQAPPADRGDQPLLLIEPQR